MIRGLAIETSGKEGSVALSEDGGVVSESTFPHGFKHAAELIPTMDRLVRERDWKPSSVDEVYVSIGPGSFTGLRVGVTAAKVFCFSIGARAVAVSSMLALAHQAPAEAGQALIVLDAKRGQVFTALYRRTEQPEAWQVVEPPHLDTLSDILGRTPRPLWLMGEGLPFHQSSINEHDEGLIVTPAASWRVAAGKVASIGHAMARRGDFADVRTLAPLYVRLPEAEEKRLASTASNTDKQRERNQAPQPPEYHAGDRKAFT